ncbi:MAG: cyclic nucleotide-binding domain-containing protein [Deltaproteobacteria bacterium]|nr:cyclic nucleotide-binding domain-containing protein [Deltaproteobacteria bacterium]
MESLATVLRRVPLFADLPPGGLAKIIADLREEQHPRGTVICYEGEAAHDFYIIKSGTLEILVNRGGNQREGVAVIGAHEWFGERALFSDSSRSATVMARTDVELWRLPKEKFDSLIEENPWLILQFTRVLSDRLYSRNQELSKVQAAFNWQTDALFRAQSSTQQEFLTQTSPLATLDPTIVRELTGYTEAETQLARLAESGNFVSGVGEGLHYPEAIREFLHMQLRERVGDEGVRALHQRAAELYERRGQWALALDHYLAAQAFQAAEQALISHANENFAADRLDSLQKWLDHFPQDFRENGLAPLQQRLAQAFADEPEASSQTPQSGFIARHVPAWLTQWLAGGFGIALALGIWFAPPVGELNTAAMRMLALLAWAVVFWVFDVLPDYVVGIGLVVGWILFSIVPPEVAVSGFTASPFFLIIGVLGMTASLQSSGLLFRLALHILRSFPLTYRGQTLGLGLSGSGITTCIPDTTSGTAIAGPIILALSDSLGYTRRSNGSAGLAMAAMLGFGQMSPFFLTGAAENLLAWGLLPDAARAQISWGGWFLAALPAAIVTFLLAFLVIQFLFPPEFQPTVSRGLIDTQIEALGPLSRAELINALVVFGAMVGWISAPYHSVDVAWVAMLGLLLLLATNLLDRIAFRSGINWDFLFYLGAVLSLTSVVRQLGIDTWVIRLLTPLLEPLAANPTQFLLVMAVAIFAARFILPSFPLVSLLTLTIVPIATAAGINPLPLLLVICISVTVWFLPYQSTCYLALYFGTKEKAFSHSQVRMLAWSFGVIYWLAIAVSIPYWRWLKLLP